ARPATTRDLSLLAPTRRRHRDGSRAALHKYRGGEQRRRGSGGSPVRREWTDTAWANLPRRAAHGPPQRLRLRPDLPCPSTRKMTLGHGFSASKRSRKLGSCSRRKQNGDFLHCSTCASRAIG